MTRIATAPHHSLVLFLANKNQERLQNFQIQGASGQKSTLYSGISANSQRLVNLESGVAGIEQYLSNGNTAKLRLQRMESAVAELTSLATAMKAKLVQATSGNQAADLNINVEARNALAQIESTLNARLDGRYLFAGGNTDARAVDFSRTPLPAQSVSQKKIPDGNALLSGLGVTASIDRDGNKRTEETLTIAGTTDKGIGIGYRTTDTMADIVRRINANADARAAGIRARISPDLTDGGGNRLIIEDLDTKGRLTVSDTSNFTRTLDMKTDIRLQEDKGYYRGDQTMLATRLDKDFMLSYGLTAVRAPFERLIRGLRVASGTNDEKSLKEALALVNDAVRELPNVRSEIGIDLAQIDRQAKTLNEVRLFSEKAIGDIENVDATAIIARVATEATALRASYMLIAKLKDISLTQYLR